LAVAGAFHTSLMQPALDRLADTLQSIEIREPRIPVISNVDTQAHSDPEEIREILVKQVINPVQWEASCQKMMQLGVDEFYEIGPGKVLRGLLRRMNRKIACTNVN
jgi:[acyl-carrier-protein] S-malonyltransferase